MQVSFWTKNMTRIFTWENNMLFSHINLHIHKQKWNSFQLVFHMFIPKAIFYRAWENKFQKSISVIRWKTLLKVSFHHYFRVVYTCQLFFSKMHEILRLHGTWISKDLLTASEDCEAFGRLPKITEDFWWLPKIAKDFQTTSKDSQRCRKIFDDFKTGQTISNLEHY